MNFVENLLVILYWFIESLLILELDVVDEKPHINLSTKETDETVNSQRETKAT